MKSYGKWKKNHGVKEISRKLMWLSRSKDLKFMIYIKEMSRKIMGLWRSKGLNLCKIMQEKEEKSWG